MELVQKRKQMLPWNKMLLLVSVNYTGCYTQQFSHIGTNIVHLHSSLMSLRFLVSGIKLDLI